MPNGRGGHGRHRADDPFHGERVVLHFCGGPRLRHESHAVGAYQVGSAVEGGETAKGGEADGEQAGRTWWPRGGGGEEDLIQHPKIMGWEHPEMTRNPCRRQH